MEERRYFFNKYPTRILFPELGKTHPKGRQVWKSLGDQESSEREIPTVKSDQAIVEEFLISSNNLE